MKKRKDLQKKLGGIVLSICTLMLMVVQPVYALDNTVIDNCEEEIKEDFINQIYSYIEQSDIIETDENIEIRFVDKNESSDIQNYMVVDSPQEVVDFLETKEKNMEDTSYYDDATAQTADSYAGEIVPYSTSSTVTDKKIFTRGIGILNINLSADVTYNTSTHVISKVANRSLTITGVTITTRAENRKYNTYYSSTKKTCKVTCNYQDVSGLVTPIGALEIVRKDAYQQFKWSYSKGIYDGKGGYGYADTSF